MVGGEEGNRPTPGAGGDLGGDVGSASGGGERTNRQKRRVPLEGGTPREALVRSKTRFARDPNAARATEVGPAGTAGPGTTSPLESAKVDGDELATAVPLVVR